MRPSTLLCAATSVAALACGGLPPTTRIAPASGESHLANIRQLTHGGENAEAYFSADGRRLIFQSTRDGRSCDQQYVMDIDGSHVRRVSTGTGETTCGYFFAYDKKIFFASTHAVDTACPPRPDPSKGYVWGLDPFDIYTANADGSDLQRLTHNGVYTAEGTLSPDGRTIVFTSLVQGDLDIYTMNVDGTNVRRLTSAVGYDGGPFFSPDGKQIVYRAYHPTDSAELADYRSRLAQHIVRPSKMEIWVMNADGSAPHPLTTGGAHAMDAGWSRNGRWLCYVSGPVGTPVVHAVRADGTGDRVVTPAGQVLGHPSWS